MIRWSKDLWQTILDLIIPWDVPSSLGIEGNLKCSRRLKVYANSSNIKPQKPFIYISLNDKTFIIYDTD